MRPEHHGQSKSSAERMVNDIRRATRRHFSANVEISIALEGLLRISRGELPSRSNLATLRLVVA